MAKKDAVKGTYVSIHSSGFRDFLLKPEILRAIVDCGFEHPSEGECRNKCTGRRSISSRTWLGLTLILAVPPSAWFCLGLSWQNWLCDWARWWNIPNLSFRVVQLANRFLRKS